MMRRPLLVLILAVAAAFAAYIPDSGRYSLLTQKERSYKYQLMALNKSGAYTVEQINKAIKKDEGGLAAFARLVAYDAMGKGAEAEASMARLESDKEALASIAAYPRTCLLLADISLRQGRFDAVEKLLPKLKFLMWDDRDLVDRAYYYRGMAHYLKTGEYNNDFMLAVGQFDKARDIYLEKKGY